jgi:hypothetical protein
MIESDDRGQVFTRVGNIRVTYIPASGRNAEANWAGSDVVRVQSYKNSTDDSLHMGVEFPVPSPDSFAQLIAAICQVYVEGRKSVNI